jgi:hypothetical protein
MSNKLPHVDLLRYALAGATHAKAELETMLQQAEADAANAPQRGRPPATLKVVAIGAETPTPRARVLSPGARKRIAAATRKRWALYRKAKEEAEATTKPKARTAAG